MDIQQDEIVDRLHDHIYAPDEAKTEAVKASHKMKMRAVSTEETVQQLNSDICSHQGGNRSKIATYLPVTMKN